MKKTKKWTKTGATRWPEKYSFKIKLLNNLQNYGFDLDDI